MDWPCNWFFETFLGFLTQFLHTWFNQIELVILLFLILSFIWLVYQWHLFIWPILLTLLILYLLFWYCQFFFIVIHFTIILFSITKLLNWNTNTQFVQYIENVLILIITMFFPFHMVKNLIVTQNFEDFTAIKIVIICCIINMFCLQIIFKLKSFIKICLFFVRLNISFCQFKCF